MILVVFVLADAFDWTIALSGKIVLNNGDIVSAKAKGTLWLIYANVILTSAFATWSKKYRTYKSWLQKTSING